MKRAAALALAALLAWPLAGCQTPEELAGSVPEESGWSQPPTETAPTLEPEAEPVTEPAATEPAAVREPEDTDFVRVADYLPTVRQELIYATAENFTQQRIYGFSDAFLRYGTVKKLEKVQHALEQQGLGLKIWDAFRPVSAQFKLWEACPDSNYVSDPTAGYSKHSRGGTVDVTLVDRNGNAVEMPTGFDDFTALADRDYSDCTETAAANARLLQDVMEACGFSSYFQEWWHYNDTETYPVAESFEPVPASWCYADCQEFISLRTEPDTTAETITRIPKDGEFQVLALDGAFALVDYLGLRGYVLQGYIQPVAGASDPVITPSIWTANCEEYINLRSTPGGLGIITTIPKGGVMKLESWYGSYAKVSYEKQEGYVLSSYIKPADEQYFSKNLDTVVPTDTYPYEQLLADLEALQSAYPRVVTVESIGTSEQGRDIPVLRIGDPDARYQVLLQGAIHGREHMTAWLLMAMADYWLDHGLLSYGDVCYHIIPMSNPDGVAISQSGSLEGARKEIYQRERETGVTSLGEGAYAALWKANAQGVDINRNFSAGWEDAQGRMEPSSQQYRGVAPFSSAEAAALRDYTLRYPFNATVSYHASGSVIYWEYGEKQPVNNLSMLLAQEVNAVTGYGLEGSEGVEGAGYKDWVIEDLEIPSVTIEIGCQDAPLAQRELYSIFARNYRVLPTIARWVQRYA